MNSIIKMDDLGVPVFSGQHPYSPSLSVIPPEAFWDVFGFIPPHQVFGCVLDIVVKFFLVEKVQNHQPDIHQFFQIFLRNVHFSPKRLPTLHGFVPASSE